MKEVKLELEFKRYETYEDKIREIGSADIRRGGERIREGALGETEETLPSLNQPFRQPLPRRLKLSFCFAKRHRKGVYLIKRRAVEEVLTALKKWI